MKKGVRSTSKNWTRKKGEKEEKEREMKEKNGIQVVGGLNMKESGERTLTSNTQPQQQQKTSQEETLTQVNESEIMWMMTCVTFRPEK